MKGATRAGGFATGDARLDAQLQGVALAAFWTAGGGGLTATGRPSRRLNMRDREDLAELLKAWECNPYSYDARTYSDNAEAVPPQPPRAIDTAAHNGTAIKAGQMVALCQQPECTGTRPA